MDKQLNAVIVRPLDGPPGRLVAGAFGSARQSAAIVIAAVVIVAAMLGAAVAFVRSDQAVNAAHEVARSTAAGYPAHYGLAGPSRLGSSGSSWIGYPPHFGLAGPSAVGRPASPSGIGQGYPPHYGLAGSSQVSGD